jgi:KDO2-lipid IV(A) lauroyltransferase
MLYTFSCSWADLFRFAQLTTEDLEDVTSTVEGLEHLERCAQKGGTVLLTAHLGCWEVGGLILTGRGYPASVVYVADKYKEAEEFRSLLRGKGDIDEICLELGSAWNVLPILRALRDGRMVAVQGDRDPSDQESPVAVLGRPVSLPRGPFLVSYLTGAPILPVFVVYDKDARFQVFIEEPLELDREQGREAAIELALQEWAAILGRTIQRWPTQWYTFYDYWG